MADTVCVLNAQSCGGRTGARWPDIARKLEAAGLAFRLVETAAPGDGARLAREALQSGARTVVAVGGDGTIHEVANGFFDGTTPVSPDARLGIVPGGSGSDLIKTLGIPADADGAIAVLMADRAPAIDLGRVQFTNHQGDREARVYVNSASAGMSGEVLARMRTLPAFLSGSAAYMAASLLSIGRVRPFGCTLTIDDGAPGERRALMVVVGNGRYFGGGMEVLPRAQMDDGWLDVLVLKDRSVPELLLNFPKLYLGTHLESAIVEWVRARRVTLSADAPQLLEVDGEQPGTSPATFEVLPKALRVLH